MEKSARNPLVPNSFATTTKSNRPKQLLLQQQKINCVTLCVKILLVALLIHVVVILYSPLRLRFFVLTNVAHRTVVGKTEDTTISVTVKISQKG